MCSVISVMFVSVHCDQSGNVCCVISVKFVITVVM